ncbi:MAG TPA: hypothetical protein VKU39_21625 [Streptosporangiaceae bacterium]|nr:hypothetical protein [Streptosporangiaceae bacterium]
MALALTLGVVIAVSGHHSTSLSNSALGASASASATGTAGANASGSPVASGSPAPTASGSTAATPSGSATAATATTAVAAAASFGNGRIAHHRLGDVATAPVDAAGNAINLNQTAAQAAQSMNCTLKVPANPLTAQGLATPWQLGDACSMANFGTEGAFVEATILSPDGQVQVYNPLVITAGTTPAVTPTAPTIARGSRVIIDIGFNGTNLALTGRGATQGNCVDALGQSLIGQVSACNAVNFYQMANRELANGTLKIAAAGTANDGQACLTTRNFGMIDQDQSDNVITAYLLNANGQTAQDTAANAAAMATANKVVNGSDNKLLNSFLDTATGCTPVTATDATSAAGTDGSQALQELQARATMLANPNGPWALVPTNDEMTLVGGQMSLDKTNVYRSLVDQPLLAAGTDPAQVAAAYCQNMVNIQPSRSQLDAAKEQAVGTPVAAVGNNLSTFMGNRLAMSFTNLACQGFGLTSPVNVMVDGNQVATAVAFTVTQQKATVNGQPLAPIGTQPGPGQGRDGGDSHMQDPSGE